MERNREPKIVYLMFVAVLEPAFADAVRVLTVAAVAVVAVTTSAAVDEFEDDENVFCCFC